MIGYQTTTKIHCEQMRENYLVDEIVRRETTKMNEKEQAARKRHVQEDRSEPGHSNESDSYPNQ